jgi:dTDP-4-amino-4,6-dideoxygalactose transaminase
VRVSLTATAIPLLDLTRQHRAIASEIDAVLGPLIASQRFILGPEVEALEEEVATYVGATFAVGCASGTDALLLPLRALELGQGAGVVVPAFTFFATAGAVWNAGLRPSFCDVDPDTFNVTRATVEHAWAEDTAAVIPVHLFGQMAPMSELTDLARARGAFLLEDAAQAIGARQDEVRAGAAGDACALSFFPTKNLGGFGDGGMITTGEPGLADKLRKIRVHGGIQMYHHEMVGTNSRLDALQAAVLRAKLPHLESWTLGRQRNAALYDELLAGIPEVTRPTVAPGNRHVFNQYTIRALRRDELRDFLSARGIGSGVYYPLPLHLQQCFRYLGYARGDFPVAERLATEVLSLPVFPELSEGEVRRVASGIRAFYGS